MSSNFSILAAPAPAVRTPDDTAAHLHKAERQIAWLRWVGIVSWLIVLQRQGFAFEWSPVWVVFLIGVACAAFAQWRLRDVDSIRTSAGLMTVCDPILAALICLVTGGIGSVFYPFFYFTLLAAAFRFGVREALAVLALNTALTVLLYFFAPGSVADLDALVIAVLYLSFAAVLGAMLAGWARANLTLALNHARALRTAVDNARTLLHRLISAVEDERKRIASELHDRMGGRLFTLQQGLDQCARLCADSPALHRQLTALAAEARACTADVRAVMNELRPTVLDDLGICEALREYCANLADVVPFALVLRIDPALQNWRSHQDAMLFRLVQEALLNCRKHANARRVDIDLRPVGEAVMLTITDDGGGFDPAGVAAGRYGLLTMRERAEALGGTLAIDPELVSGTRVTVRLPRDTRA